MANNSIYIDRVGYMLNGAVNINRVTDWGSTPSTWNTVQLSLGIVSLFTMSIHFALCFSVWLAAAAVDWYSGNALV